MIRDLCVHRTDHRDIVSVFGGTGKEIADLDTRFAVTAESERGSKGGSCFTFGRERFLQQLAILTGQFGLRVEGVNM